MIAPTRTRRPVHCPRCRNDWKTAQAGKVQCPKCRTVCNPKRPAGLLTKCPDCRHQWLCQWTEQTKARCPSCGVKIQKFKGSTQRCAFCLRKWTTRKPLHPDRPRCPSCFRVVKKKLDSKSGKEDKAT